MNSVYDAYFPGFASAGCFIIAAASRDVHGHGHAQPSFSRRSWEEKESTAGPGVTNSLETRRDGASRLTFDRIKYGAGLEKSLDSVPNCKLSH